jgi:hypothetical protein
MPLNEATVARLADLFREGATNRAAALALGIGKDTAARYRAALGIGPAPKRLAANRSVLSVEQKFMTYTRAVEGGHLEWRGRHHKAHGTPVFTHREQTYTARSVAFRIAHGRAPEGYVTVECGNPECVAPAHVDDEPGRTRARAQFAAVLGIATALVECSRGHDATTHRRYDRAGRAYCGTCHADAKRARLAVEGAA